MRALKLSMTAFGPYLDKQVIDFEALGDESIFLITGPTGAGKTTIFDAICFALYGKASGSDRDQDSLRSHFAAADEPTEVEFQFALNNKVYEIVRNPKQLKKKERGDGYTEEPAKAQIYEIKNGEKYLLSSRIKDVNETIEDRLGFDYEQFRKMVLIPQGEFRKLISENSREREAILQKIFRTHFYEKMTEELKVKSKELEAELTKLKNDIHYELSKVTWQQVDIPEDDTTENYLEMLKNEIEETKNLEMLQQNLKDKQLERVAIAEEKLRKASLVEEKYKEQQTLTKQFEDMEQQKDSISDKKEKLKLAKIAEKIIPLEDQANARKEEWNHQIVRLQKQKEKVSQLKLEFATVHSNYQDAQSKEHERENLKQEINDARKKLDQVNSYLTLTKEVEKLKREKEKYNINLQSIEREIQDNDAKLSTIEKQLTNESILTKTYYETKETLTKQEELHHKLIAYQFEENKLVDLRRQYLNAQDLYKEKQAIIKQLKTEYDRLEQQQKEQFASVLAHQLVSGEPCPVCGSTHHPNKAVHESIENNFEQIDLLKQQIQKEELEFEMVQREFVDHKTNGQTQRGLVDKLQAEIHELYPSFNSEEIDSLLLTLNHEINSIKNKLAAIIQKQKELENMQTEREALQNRSKELKQTFDLILVKDKEINDDLVRREAILEQHEKQLPTDLKNPAEFSARIIEKENYYNRIMEEWEQLKSTFEAINDSLKREITVLEQQEEFEKETKRNFDIQQEKFVNLTIESGFETLEAYNQVKLPLEMQQNIKTEIETFDVKMEQIRYRLTQLQEQLASVERVNLDEIEAEVTAYKHELNSIHEKLLTLQSKRKHDEDILQNLLAILTKMKKLDADYYIVGSLADLSSGNNALRLSFERYVLASFLDEILLQANIRLDRMTDHRYQLIRSGEVAKRGAQSGLDLEVMDHHTGITRSVKTLSGGEGFKAALSLALGLADVVQAHAGGVQLDTLFIDEGFGTLDEVSLQQAIDCLKDLQESNRLLGIISHVPALKNEIHAKLVITPSHRGSNLGFSFGK
jgi:DNA repair protein SbcC/Rad50